MHVGGTVGCENIHINTVYMHYKLEYSNAFYLCSLVDILMLPSLVLGALLACQKKEVEDSSIYQMKFQIQSICLLTVFQFGLEFR